MTIILSVLFKKLGVSGTKDTMQNITRKMRMSKLSKGIGPYILVSHGFLSSRAIIRWLSSTSRKQC